jgi:hypothetical protein
MSLHQKSIWAVLHAVAIVGVLISLASGLRIAILEYPLLLRLHYFLPQGEMHSLHITSAVLVTGVSLVFILLLLSKQLPNTSQLNKAHFSGRYHWLLAWWLRSAMTVLLISGWFLYLGSDVLDASVLKVTHLFSAALLATYIILHGGGYCIQYGRRVIRRTFSPLRFLTAKLWFGITDLSGLLLLSGITLFDNQQYNLAVSTIDQEVYIQVDGKTNEAVWQQAEPLTINTHGGANFDDGSTLVTIRALQNGQDAFFHFRWKDKTKSLQHLPLIKTTEGWRVKQDGFQDFDEQTHYEDKFAVILSDSCEMDAAGTAHLGPRPLADKPKHWSGKGYHYREQGIVDLWQWKAVRTNSMRLMDDNYIGQAAKVRAGDRRYTAGYQQDGKESGAYRMNWQWYRRDGIVPRRLPNDPAHLRPYQEAESSDSSDMPWVIPWFDSQPYQKADDNYPVGTIMPSILYTSNQFEGDRAHVRAFAIWEEGYWSLEVFRRLDTQSPKDIRIADGVCLWVAAFDHSQIAHTRHVRPVQLEMAP